MKKVLMLALLFTSCVKKNTDLEFKQEPVDSGVDLTGEGEGEQMSLIVPSKACDDLRNILCAKVATCSDTVSYEKCQLEYDPEQKCEQATEDKVKQCFQEFVDVNCSQDLPASCLEL